MLLKMCLDMIQMVIMLSHMPSWYILHYLDQFLCGATLWRNGYSKTAQKRILSKWQ